MSGTRTQGKGWPFGVSDTGPFLELSKVAPSPKYGYAQDSPILVGGTESGPKESRLYLNSLRGPQGQVVSYERIGSCCPFETPNSSFGGLLDMYLIQYEGLKTPITLYVNMYDPGELLIPQGFTARH